MYLPLQFKAKDQTHAWNLVRAHPFASLISLDDDGQPLSRTCLCTLSYKANGRYCWGIAPNPTRIGAIFSQDLLQ